MSRAAQLMSARRLRHQPFALDEVTAALRTEVASWSSGPKSRRAAWGGVRRFLAAHSTGEGLTVQQWWDRLEPDLFALSAGATTRGLRWPAAVRALVTGRLVQPTVRVTAAAAVEPWICRLPDDDPLVLAHRQLREVLGRLGWPTEQGIRRGTGAGLRVMLVNDYDRLSQIVDADVRAIPAGGPNGTDMLDVALCAAGIFARSPQRGTSRRRAEPPRTVEQLVAQRIPPPFDKVTVAYVTAYQQRVSRNYSTTRTKIRSLAYFWAYMTEEHPGITACRQILPHHARGFVPWALAKARTVQRSTGRKGTEDRTTTYDWFVDVRAFFADICHWSTEPGSPLSDFAPPTIPLTSHDLNSGGFSAARSRTTARMTASVMDLTREIPSIRAFALRRWHDSQRQLTATPQDRLAVQAERNSFWDWALLELLLTTGLRVEEASELTTLDILKRHLPDGQIYYLLHIKPSKYDRARVIPIGDGLGQVIAEIIGHIKAFYHAGAVPPCDRRDNTAKTWLPRAPYLLQGVGHPSAMSTQTIRGRLQDLSLAAGARHADGTDLRLNPHDCRRAFATEHLNNNTPVHVIAALLGHASLDTVMIYAKLYPDALVEGYRTAMRGLYTDIYDADAVREPSTDEWAAFVAGCNLRDMGTHVCALPTGEHCTRGLVCLGCHHAQPKKSAAPVFRRMIASHTRALTRAREAGEPAGQIAARELEIDRLRAALQRAEELNTEASAALEAAAL